MSIERILCPANFPLEFDGALVYTASLARVFQAKLFLCHCAPTPALVSFETNVANHDQVRTQLADSLKRYLGPPEASQLSWEILVVQSGNDIGEEIVRTAREQRIDLIVMRSRRSPVAALLGSTAEQVSRTASCPVLVISLREPTRETRANGRAVFERVLASHDFSSSSELALSYALSIAQKYQSELHLLHVLPEPQDEPEIAWGPMGVESAYHRAARRLRDSVPAEVYKRCTVTHSVRWGKPYREVLAYAREHNIDLVCMGALGRDFGLEALFGSNVDRVLRQATCPVLVARPLKPAVPAVVNLSIAKPGLRRTVTS
ncbi:MAG: universal stress protein [Pyrinomonadaceae bacterium]